MMEGEELRSFLFEAGRKAFETTAENSAVQDMKPSPTSKDVYAFFMTNPPFVFRPEYLVFPEWTAFGIFHSGWLKAWEDSACSDPEAWKANGGNCSRCGGTHTLPRLD